MSRTVKSPWRGSAIAALLLLLSLLLVSGAQARPLGAGPLAETNKAPKVTKDPSPVKQTIEEGQPASFASVASGTPTPTAQWEVSTNGGTSWNQIAGATSPTYAIAAVNRSESGDLFRVTYKNVAGEATSKTGSLTVQKPVTINQPPHDTAVLEGQNAIFTVSADGFPTPTIKWELSTNNGSSWSIVSGATSSELVLAKVTTLMNGNKYRTTLENGIGPKVVSSAATLSVQRAPAVYQQPSNLTIEEGHAARFEALATGLPTPSVRWEISLDGGETWSPIEGATSTGYEIAAVNPSETGHRFRATFTNAAGTAVSEAVSLTVVATPTITRQPVSTIVQVGETASFEAEASGNPTPTVQWEVSSNGGGSWSEVAGATGDLLALEHTQAFETGHSYRAKFANSAGSTLTKVATLTVTSTKFGAVAWGSNANKQLGDGGVEGFSDVPVPVNGLKFVSAVDVGGRHSLALTADGSVYAWGRNGLGQLGDGTINDSAFPEKVPGLSEVTAIAAGNSHSLALLANGTVMAWGDNESGQLGIGSNAEDSLVPVAVSGLAGVKAIAAGNNFSLALLQSGTVVAWGENEDGELGDGSLASRNQPVSVKSLSGVKAISAGADFSLALLEGGTVEAWGDNTREQLADKHAVETELPYSKTAVEVEGLSGIASISAGMNHSLARTAAGTVMAWGDDADGELGNGVVQPYVTLPVPVAGLSGVAEVSAGGQASAALLTSGAIDMWGSDASGFLGNGHSGGNSTGPVSVVGIAAASDVSVGRTSVLAYGEPLPVVTEVSPPTGASSGGTVVTINGASFGGATAVKFGSTAATSFSVDSSTQIKAVAPPGTGAVDITVATPAGASPATSADRFTYLLAPAIKKLAPKTGPATGGTTVTITGSELSGVTGVTFGGVPATTFTSVSSTTLTVLAPASVAGTVDVVVTTNGGVSAIVAKDHYKYTPVVTSVSPGEGLAKGGTVVHITGSGFATAPGATSFKFGKKKASAVSCTSAGECTATAPAGAGTVDVVATVNKAAGAANAPGDHYTYD